MGKPKYINSKMFTILDLLDADRGWLTTQTFLYLIPGIRENSIKQNLRRLRERGYLESRERETQGWGESPESEWRITEAGRQHIDIVTAAA